MPIARINGTDLFYEDTGPGSTGETMVFSHGLLFSSLMWEAQIAHFRDRYRCIAYDHRGQGRSADCDMHAIDMELVYDDGRALIERLVAGPVHFVGLSMGGFVGMRLAARRPDLVRTLALFETSADPEPPENVPRYERLALVAHYLGVKIVAEKVVNIMFAKSFLADRSRASEREFWRTRLAENRRTIDRALRGVTQRRGCYDELASIRVPTLVATGAEDIATVPAKGERIHQAIAGSRFVLIPGAGHSSSVEQPERVNEAIEALLASAQPHDNDDQMLAHTRRTLDTIDAGVLALVRDRIAVVDRLFRWKDAHGLPRVDPVREESLLAARSADAERAGVPVELATRLFRTLLDDARRPR